MRTSPFMAVAAVLTVATVASACSSGSGGTPAAGSSTPQTTASSAAPSASDSESHTAAPGQVGVSPAGVTTAVGTPASSTENEYFQACADAKKWMVAKGGDLKAQFEPYLADLQKTDAATPGTFGKPWSQLPPDRQSAVIVAADAAAADLCN
jgi:hypothetical protein